MSEWTRVAPEDLQLSAATVDVHTDELHLRHATAHGRIEGAQVGVPTRSAAALGAAVAKWQADTTVLFRTWWVTALRCVARRRATSARISPMTRRLTSLLIAMMVSVALPSCVKPSRSIPLRHRRIRNWTGCRRSSMTGAILKRRSNNSSTSMAKSAPSSRNTPRRRSSDLLRARPIVVAWTRSHNIGDDYGIDKIYARPAPTDRQSKQIIDALAPVFSAAKFRPNVPPNTAQPAGAFSQIRDDGATVELINSPGAMLAYSYSTGCRRPAAWRTAPPPTDQRPANDSGVHYP